MSTESEHFGILPQVENLEERASNEDPRGTGSSETYVNLVVQCSCVDVGPICTPAHGCDRASNLEHCYRLL